MIIKKLLEAKDISLFTRFLRILGEYCKNWPATGLDTYFDMAINTGKSIMPKDKTAQAILDYAFTEGSSNPDIIQKLLNLRFSDLPVGLRPIIKAETSNEIAFWYNGDQISDKIFSLIKLDGYSKKVGYWCTPDGKKAILLDLRTGE
jgi:hypothetical protein